MALPIGAVLVDPRTAGFLAFNDAACATVGHSRAEMAALRLSDLDVDHSLEQLLLRVDDVLRTKAPATFRTRLRTAGGSLKLVEVTARAITMAANPAVYALWNDVSERSEADARQRVAVEASDLGTWEWDPVHDRIVFDARARAIFAMPGTGAIDGATLRERIVPEDRDAVRRRLAGCADPSGSGAYAIEYRIVVPQTGETRWIVSHGRGIFEADASGARRCVKVLGALQDATVALASRDAARAAAEQGQRVLDNLMCFVGVLDLEGRVLEINASALLAAGISAAQAVGSPFWETHWWSHDSAVAEQIREACRACASGRVQRFDTTYRTAGGTSEVDFVLMPLRDAQGRITHLVPNGIDIAERKRAEREVVAQRDTLALAAEATQLGVWDWDLEGERLAWSQRMRDMFGLGPDAPVTFDHFMAHVHPDDRPAMDVARRAALDPSGNGRYECEYRALRGDGQQRRMLAHAQVHFAERDGVRRAVRMVGTVLDVTDSRRLLDEHAQLTTLTRAIGQATPTFLYLKDRSGRLLYCNPSVLEALDLPADRVIGHVDRDFLGHGAATDAIEAHDREVMESGRTLFLEEHLPSIDRTYLSTKTPWRDASGRIAGLAGVSFDITEQRRIEAALRHREAELAVSEERQRLAIEATAAGTYDWDLVTGHLRWDERCRSLFGIDAEEPPTVDAFLARVHPDDREDVRERLQRALCDPTFDGLWQARYRILGLDGRCRWLDSPGRLYFEGEGDTRRPVRMVGLVTDVTDRVEAEQRLAESERALRESEERLRLAVQTSSLGWWDMDPRSRRILWSENARRMFDLPEDGEVLLDAPVQRMHPEDRDRVVAAIDAAFGPGADGSYREQYRVVWRDGAVRWIDAVGLVTFAAIDGGRQAIRFVGVLWDVTEQRQLVDGLREADRRKDEFLAMLAHELRNPLAPVINAVRVLERTEAFSEVGRRALDMVQRQVAQMKRLVDDLLEVSRITRGKIDLKPEPMLLNTAIPNAVEAVIAACDAKRQSLEVVLPPKLLRLNADPVRVAQILENLLGNASKYTPEGGSIRVEAVEQGAELEVRVIDDGMGIAPDKLESVFELFVQAEPGVGEHQGGLGIGLAMVKRLVEMHGGRVHAESAGPGQGSVFVVRLPGRG